MRAGDSTPLRPNSAGTKQLALAHNARPASANAAPTSPVNLKRSNYRLRILKHQETSAPSGHHSGATAHEGIRSAGGFIHAPSKPLLFDDGSSVGSAMSSQSLYRSQTETHLPQISQHRQRVFTQPSGDMKSAFEPNSPWGLPKENIAVPNRKSWRNEEPGSVAAWSPLSTSNRGSVGNPIDRDVESVTRVVREMRISSIGRESTQLSTAGTPHQFQQSPLSNQRAPMRPVTSHFNGLCTQSDCGPMLDATQETTFSQQANQRYYQDYNEVAQLGRGNFGQVTLCKDKHTGELVAVKRLGPFAGHHDAKQHIRETTVLTCIRSRSKHVVQLLSSFVDGQVPGGGAPRLGHAYGYLVMQYCPNGTLAEALEWRRRVNQGWSEAEVITFAAEMAEALHTLHAHDIAHVDFKPDNILLDTDLGYVLTDFGLSQFIDPTSGRPVAGRATGAVARPARISTGTLSQVRESGRTSASTTVTNVRNSASAVLFPAGEVEPPSGLISALADRSASVAYSLNTQASQDEGDSRYVSPDMLNFKTNYFAGDTFALGVTLFEMMTGVPAPKNGPLHTELRSGDRNALLNRCPQLTSGVFSHELLDLVFSLLCVNPDRSMRAFDVLRHPALSAGCIHAVQHAVEQATVPLANASWRPLPRVPLAGLLLGDHHATGKCSPDPMSQTLDGHSPLSDDTRMTHDWSSRSPLNVGQTGNRRPREDSDSPMDTTPTGEGIPGEDCTPLPLDTSPTTTVNMTQPKEALWAIMANPQFVQMRFAAAQMLVLSAILRTQIPLRPL